MRIKILFFVIALVLLITGSFLLYKHLSQKNSIPESTLSLDIETIQISTNRIVLSTLDDLIADSDFIGIIESERDFWEQTPEITYTEDNFLESFATRSRVKVLSTFHGDIPENSYIDIIEPAAMVDINNEMYFYALDGYKPLNPLTEYIVFAKKNDNGDLAIANINESVFYYNAIDEDAFVRHHFHLSPDRVKIYQEIIEKWWTK